MVLSPPRSSTAMQRFPLEALHAPDLHDRTRLFQGSIPSMRFDFHAHSVFSEPLGKGKGYERDDHPAPTKEPTKYYPTKAPTKYYMPPKHEPTKYYMPPKYEPTKAKYEPTKAPTKELTKEPTKEEASPAPSEADTFLTPEPTHERKSQNLDCEGLIFGTETYPSTCFLSINSHPRTVRKKKYSFLTILNSYT